jgi:hypothetical protein
MIDYTPAALRPATSAGCGANFSMGWSVKTPIPAHVVDDVGAGPT